MNILDEVAGYLNELEGVSFLDEPKLFRHEWALTNRCTSSETYQCIKCGHTAVLLVTTQPRAFPPDACPGGEFIDA